MDMVLNPTFLRLEHFSLHLWRSYFSIFTVLGVQNLLVLTSDQPFSPPPRGAKAPFLFATPKDEGHRASLRGSQLYLLEREREMGLKKKSKNRNEKKRETEEGCHGNGNIAALQKP